MTKAELAKCLMVDAVEGQGIAYWAEIKGIKRDDNHYVLSFMVRDVEREEKDGKWCLVNVAKVTSAVKRLLDNFQKYGVHRDYAACFLGNDWDYDMHGVDIIIQIVAFDKVIFG